MIAGPMTDAERAAYHDRVLRAATHFDNAHDVVHQALAFAELIRAARAAERSGAWPLPRT